MLHTAWPLDLLPFCFSSSPSHTSPVVNSFAFSSQSSRPDTQQVVSGSTPEWRPAAPDGFLRLRRSRINAVRAKRLTTAHHAPSQKVKNYCPFLLRSEGYTKAHGTAAVRNWNVKGEQKVLGLIWVWVYGARCSMTGYTSYQMQ